MRFDSHDFDVTARQPFNFDINQISSTKLSQIDESEQEKIDEDCNLMMLLLTFIDELTTHNNVFVSNLFDPCVSVSYIADYVSKIWTI